MAGMADDDRLNGLLLKLGAVLVAICAATTFALVYYTIDEHDETYDFKVVFMRLTDCGLGLLPTFEPSDIEKPGLNIFLMHIFFMALAFALLGPIGAVAYVLAEDVLKLPHSVAKWMHALIQFGALAASILGECLPLAGRLSDKIPVLRMEIVLRYFVRYHQRWHLSNAASTRLLIYGGKLPMPAIRELDPTKYEKQV
eukprot:6210045-Pleurochrysis_carterae.AAC.1